MAGTLTISTLSDGTNSTSSTNCIQGSAKAWATFGSTGAINASYNVSSVTRNATGDYTVNFTNAFSDKYYTVAGTASNNAIANANCYFWNYGSATQLTTSCRMIITQGGSGNVDCAIGGLAFFR